MKITTHRLFWGEEQLSCQGMGRTRIERLLAQIEGLDAMGQFLPLGRGDFQGPQIQEDPLPGPPAGEAGGGVLVLLLSAVRLIQPDRRTS